MGEMSAGITEEEEIDEGSTLANKWIEVKEWCQYYFCYAIYSVSDQTLLSPPERTQKHNSI